MPSLSDTAGMLALKVAAAGPPAFTDPAQAYNNRPCVLIAPPVIRWDQGTMTGPSIDWRIVALSSYDTGTADALDELEALIEAADTALGLRDATPTQYALTPDGRRVAAYLCTTTTY